MCIIIYIMGSRVLNKKNTFDSFSGPNNTTLSICENHFWKKELLLVTQGEGIRYFKIMYNRQTFLMDARKAGRGQGKGHCSGATKKKLKHSVSQGCQCTSECLISRMNQCGEGASLANKRRETWSRVELAMRTERERQFVATMKLLKNLVASY